MPKLNQIIAIEKGVKSRAYSEVGELQNRHDRKRGRGRYGYSLPFA